jgi:hypothetical protein
MTSALDSGIRAFRVVARRAKLALGGATHEEAEETVVTDEMEEARDEREWSLIMDSGLERDERVLLTEGRRIWYLSSPVPGNSSPTQRLNPARCANAMAEHIEGRRGPQALTAGVLEGIDEIAGVN